MAANVLRLLMILSLALNGAGAPLAMAGGPPPSASAAMQQPGVPAPAGGCEKHLAAPDEAPAMPGRGDSAPGEAGGGCCDGPGCHCGCTLPSLMHDAGPPGPSAAPLAARAAASLPMAGAGHGHPPYRPPNG